MNHIGWKYIPGGQEWQMGDRLLTNRVYARLETSGKGGFLVIEGGGEASFYAVLYVSVSTNQSDLGQTTRGESID